MRRTHLVAVGAASVTLLAAGDARPGIGVRLDLSTHPVVRATVVTSEPSRAPVVRERGRPAAGATAVNLGAAKSVVVAIDRSRSMAGRPLADAVAAARGFVQAKSGRDRIAVVAFGSDAVQLTRFTTSTAEVDAALAGLSVDGRQGTALADAVALAAEALATEPEHGRVIVLVTDGRDVGSDVTAAAAVAAARRTGAVAYPIGVHGADFAPRALRRFARATGGRAFVTASTATLPAVYSAIRDELQRTWRVEWVTAAQPGEKVRVRVVAPGAGAAEMRLAPPGNAQAPAGAPSGLHRNGVGDLLVSLLAALLLLGAAARVRAYRRTRRLRARLAPARAHEEGDAPRVPLRRRLRASGQTLFGATESVFGGLRQWQALQRLIDRANVPLRAVELVYGMLAAGVVVSLLAAAFGASALGLLIAFVVGAFAPVAWVARRARRRRRAFDDQLPELLLTLAGSLKAGQSFRQGLQTLVDEGGDPAAQEFAVVLGQARLGRSLDDALAEMADRVGSENFTFVVQAVAIQRQVGGSLAGLFDMVSDTVRNRQQFGRRVRAITAQGRISAYVLLGLPVFMALGLSVLNPTYMEPLLHTSAGQTMLVGAAVMMGFGWLVLRRIVAVKAS